MINTFHDRPYIKLVNHILAEGVMKPSRPGIMTKSVFGYQMKFDLSDGTIPLLTTKKMFTRGVIHEILWYLMGSDNIKYLKDNNVNIWNEWADDHGSLGPVYGVQWRKWADDYGGAIDQITQLIDTLRTNPNDRRLLVSAWNVGQLSSMALPPCHYSFQCYAEPLSLQDRVFEAGRRFLPADIMQNTTPDTIEAWLDEIGIPSYQLSMLLNQRSCDVGLGVPFNIVQYSILLRMIAEVVNMTPGTFTWNGGDVHIYENHLTPLTDQVKLTPFPSPTLTFNRRIAEIDDFRFDDFVISGYQSHPTIKMDVAV